MGNDVASISKIVTSQIPYISTSVAPKIDPQYGMPLNYFAGQTPPPPSGQNRPVRLHGQAGLTGHGAMVPYPSSPEPLATIPPVQAVSGRSGEIPRV